MGSLVPWERDDESKLDGEIHWGTIYESYDPCWGGVGLEDLVVHREDHVASVWLDHMRKDQSEEFLLGIKWAEGKVVVDLGVVFSVIPEPVAVDRWLHAGYPWWALRCIQDRISKSWF